MRKIINNIGWIFFDKIFRMAAGILVGIWIARYLGPNDFGILNYALLFPTLFSSIAGFGLTNVLMVEYVSANNDPLKQHSLVVNGLTIKLVSGILMYCFVFLLNYILNYDNFSLFLLVSITGTALIFQSSDVLDTYFQAQTKAKLSVIVKLIAFSLATAIRVYGLLTHQSILFFVIVNVIELLLGYGLIIGVYQRYTGRLISVINQAVNWPLLAQLMRIGWPIMFTEFFVFIYMRVDQFMIESLSTNRELGLYGAVLRLSEAWYFVCIAITTSFYPKIAALWDTNRQGFYKNYQQMLNLLIYISLGVAVLTSLFADTLITLLYGPKFHGAGIILSVHIWTGLFVYIGVGTNNLFIVNNLQQFVLIRTIVGALINIIINYWLVPQYGALGSSIATLFAQFCSAYALNFFYNRAKPIFYLQSRALLSVLTLRKPVLHLIT